MMGLLQSTPELPLLRTRMILLVLSLIFLIASESATVATFTKHKHAQHLINNFVPSGVTVKLGDHDVMITIVAVFIAAQLLTTLVSNIVIAHLQNIYNILPPHIARTLGMGNAQLASSTLGYQALAFAVLLIFNAISLAFFTAYAFTREYTIEVEAPEDLQLPANFGRILMEQLGIAVAYRDTGYTE
ncbi:CSC1/OSCA1-like 7TM region domain-containing protein [Pleurotus pulmonarius]